MIFKTSCLATGVLGPDDNDNADADYDDDAHDADDGNDDNDDGDDDDDDDNPMWVELGVQYVVESVALEGYERHDFMPLAKDMSMVMMTAIMSMVMVVSLIIMTVVIEVITCFVLEKQCRMAMIMMMT